MNATFIAFVVLCCGVIGFGLARPVPRSNSDLCWSCGRRGSHTLWCPNR
jgi:hypothetical protein